MASSQGVSQAARRLLPKAESTETVGTSSTSAIDLSDHDGQWVWLQAKGGKIHLRSGDSSVGAATTSDPFLEDGAKDEFYVSTRAGRDHIRAIADTAGSTLIIATTG